MSAMQRLCWKAFLGQFDLEIVDKPDLQYIRKDIGIGVKQGRNPKQQEIENLYSKLPYVQANAVEKMERQIEKCGGKLYGGILNRINNGEYRTLERYDYLCLMIAWI